MLKLQFAFDQQKHLTHWIAVNDGQHFLTKLTFFITHTSDYITKVSYTTDYSKGQQAFKDDSPLVRQLLIDYQWQSLPQQQPLSALLVLMAIGVVLLWMASFLVFIDTNKPDKVL